MGRLQDWWSNFWESAYHKEIDGPLTKRRATSPDEAELVVEVEGADELSAVLDELAERLRDIDWGEISATGGFASDVPYAGDGSPHEGDLLTVGEGLLVYDEKADHIRAVLDHEAQGASRWADLLWLNSELGEEHEPSYVEVGHVPSASLADSLTPPYDPAEHKTLEDIQAEADVMAQGIPMALFGGECRWWTTDINACYMDPLTESGCNCKRPCCPHCGEPLVMAPLGDFLDKANEYAYTFGKSGLWALELAHAHNLGRLMCLNDWDLYASVASLRLC